MHQDYREIITKAVCGTGKKDSVIMHEVVADHQASSVLGCWIINHQYEATQVSDHEIAIEGMYDVNIWYAYHDNEKTAVVCESIAYTEQIPLTIRDENTLHEAYDVFAKVTKQPNCLQCKVDEANGKIQAEVAKEFEVKVIGETKIVVKVEENPGIKQILKEK